MAKQITDTTIETHMSYDEIKAKDIKRTRKPHRCEWCATQIEAGAAAYHRAYIWEGEFHSSYMHPECKEALEQAPREEIMEGWYPGDYPRGSSRNINA